MQELLPPHLVSAWKEKVTVEKKAHKDFWDKVKEHYPDAPEELRIDAQYQDLDVLVLSDTTVTESMREQARKLFAKDK